MQRKEVAITTAAQALSREIRALDTQHFFLMTGRDNTLWIALQEAGVQQVLARSEATAVYMADAYARLTGRPAFAYGAYGPGAANVAGALAEPYWSSSPVVAVVSAMRRTERFRREYQELDQIPLFASVTKWGAEAAVAGQVPRLFREAVRHALTATPGPVYFGVPGDIFEDDIQAYEGPMEDGEWATLPLRRPGATPAELDAVLAVLVAAERPVLLVGNGIHQSGAHDALRIVAERLAIPVATSSAGKGSIPETHELALGTVGRYSRKYANAAVRDADVVLAVGTQLGGLVTDSYKLISQATRLIHVTVDPEAIGLNFRTEIGLAADARAFLEGLADATDRAGVPPRTSSNPYLEGLSRERAAWRERRAALAARDGSDGRPMRPESIIAALNETLPDDAILLGDTGYAAAWSGALTDTKVAGRSFLRADGSLGWAFPAALGAQLAMPDRAVVAVTGDGGFGYHLGDLETALRLDLPVIVIILNNATLAFEAHVQTLLYDHLVPEVDDFRDVDYGQIASAFGVAGSRVTNGAQFRAALAQGLERRGPTVIDAVIDRDAIAPVTRYDRVREREL